jgi:hypothetical protein
MEPSSYYDGGCLYVDLNRDALARLRSSQAFIHQYQKRKQMEQKAHGEIAISFVRTLNIIHEEQTSFVLCRNVLEAKPLEARVPTFGPSTKYVVGSGVDFPAFFGDAFSRSEVDRDLWVSTFDLV